MERKKAILLLNIGSPDSFKTSDVKKYLRQFLSDKRVINMPAFFRYLLVNGIIVPFRAPKSAKKYKEIWTKNGSPLIHHSIELQTKLQEIYASTADVYVAMRYGNPSIPKILTEINAKNYSDLTICPLFPHNASSTTSSAIEEVFDGIKNWENLPSLKVLSEFWNHPLYVKTLADHISKYEVNSYDHVVFSYHGLPLSQVHQAHKGQTCEEENCVAEWKLSNKYCYQAVCYQTTNLLVDKLELNKKDYTTSFQSRLTKNWLAPFTDDILKQLAEQGKKNILMVCPSFVADCLETLHEIEIEYNEEFKNNGGGKLVAVPALNSDHNWVKSLFDILEK